MEIVYKAYCNLHKLSKKILGRYVPNNDIPQTEKKVKTLGVASQDAICYWLSFIENSVIPENDDFAGMYYAGFISEAGKWCLQSWIWTNAAMVRLYCSLKNEDKVLSIANRLLERQLDCGGWVVRNDYNKEGAIPMLAPNDSAYIANNGMIEAYLFTKDEKYLQSAIKCADWIIETARPDGMVYLGYDMKHKKWDKSCVIVDVGFTAGLFARLYEITEMEKYMDYLSQFITRYIELFYVPEKRGFCTNIDKDDRQNAGMFGRGQAWALEGLIPAYKVLKDDIIKNIIQATINNLLERQCRNGGWPYNLVRKLMGEDCKAVSVIAKNLMDWYDFTGDIRIKDSANNALNWCMRQTSIEGQTKGGIFSYSLEGAVVHNLYSTCAFVYASAYAVELYNKLHK